MNGKRTAPWSNYQLLGLGFCLLCAIGVFHLANACLGKSFYRDIHLGAALEFARGRIDLLRPVIVGFNATGTPTPQELPLWQAATALTFKLLGPWFGWANLVSLILFSTCLFPLYQLARIHYGERCACWTVVFFLAEPLVFLHAGLASTDGFSLAAAIWFLFFAVKLLPAPRPIWWLLTLLAGTVAALSKLPFFMAAGLAVFFLTIQFHRTSLRSWLLLGSAAALIGVAFLAWTRYTNHCLDQAVFPFVDLRPSSSSMRFWYFGDWHYRFSPGNWIKGGWRFLHACFGSLALAGVFLYSLLCLRQNIFSKLWLLGAALTTLVFSHLILHHTHYYLMFTPAVALLCAQAAVNCEKNLAGQSRGKSLLGLGIVAVALLLAIVQGLLGMKIILLQDPYPKKMVQVMEQHTTDSDKLLIAGGGWGGEELFLAHRSGLSIWDAGFLENPDNYRRLKGLGYTKIVLISESPLQVAERETNPGETAAPREMYQRLVTPLVEEWPVVFQSDDILIKELP